jgi:hypothetical protein
LIKFVFDGLIASNLLPELSVEILHLRWFFLSVYFHILLIHHFILFLLFQKFLELYYIILFYFIHSVGLW